MNKRVVFSSTAKSLMFKLLTLVVTVFLFAFYVNNYYSAPVVEVMACTSGQTQTTLARPSLIDTIKDFFSLGNDQTSVKPKLSVYLGGYPLGFTLECKGVMVVAIGEVQTSEGVVKPLANKDVKVGDVIAEVDGEPITSANFLQDKLNKKQGASVNLTINREGEMRKVAVVPALEEATNSYRLGVWIRDNSAGVGTLTYVRADNHRFGALGHPVTDIDTSKTFPIAGGNIYKCSIVGYNKGTRGNPGELRGLFLRSGEEAGTLDNNNDFGVYGTIKREYLENTLNKKLVDVGFRDTVKTGKAKMVCTIDGTTPKQYDIEIIKLSYQSSSSNKSMVIKVTDEELIKQTGGIVQGMSGSPILQDGKLVGAVTHVFVSDPTKGFGVYIDWMIDN